MVLAIMTLGVALDAGVITGRVIDASGDPVSDAAVCVIDAATGIPVRRSTWRAFVDSRDIESAIADIAFVITDHDGTFSIDQVQAGRYRLLAQSWEQPPSGMLEVNGSVVHVRGWTDTIDLDAGETESVEITPAGSATLVLGDHAGNDETLVVVSTEPLAADPILGFAGWTGPFLQSAAGFNRMPDGKTTFHGLPAGEVHVGVFSADNVPGIGGATVTLHDDQPMWVQIPFVVSWSDGVHSPPPRLEALTAYVDALPADEHMALRRRFAPEHAPGMSVLAMMAASRDHLDDVVEFPDGRTASGADVMAAMGYGHLRRRLEQAGRVPNAHRDPTIRPARPEEIGRR